MVLDLHVPFEVDPPELVLVTEVEDEWVEVKIPESPDRVMTDDDEEVADAVGRLAETGMMTADFFRADLENLGAPSGT